MTWDPFLESPGNLAMPGWRPYPKIMILPRTLAHKPVLLLKHYYQNLTLGLWIYCKHKIAFLGTVNTGTLLESLVAIKSARTWRLEEMWSGILLTPTRAFLGRGRPGYGAKYPNVNSNCSNTRPTILHNHVTQKISQTKWSPYPPLALPLLFDIRVLRLYLRHFQALSRIWIFLDFQVCNVRHYLL